MVPWDFVHSIDWLPGALVLPETWRRMTGKQAQPWQAALAAPGLDVPTSSSPGPPLPQLAWPRVPGKEPPRPMLEAATPPAVLGGHAFAGASVALGFPVPLPL